MCTNRSIGVAGLLAALLAGCAGTGPAVTTTASSAAALPVTPRALEELPDDGYCTVELISQTPGSSTGYTGRIVSADGDQVTLAEVEKWGRSTHETPVLSKIPSPYFRRMFKNTGIGSELLEGEQTLSREQIATVSLLDDQAIGMLRRRRDPRRSASLLDVERTDLTEQSPPGDHEQPVDSERTAGVKRYPPVYAD